jgi:8-oxo-dGTP diphosphatase
MARPPGYDPGEFPPFAVTVDLAIFTVRNGLLQVLLVQRAEPPFEGEWALPGGFVREHETLTEAATRELEEETGLSDSHAHLEQLGTYGDPDRDPRVRVVSVAHVAFLPDLPIPTAGGDAATARFWPIEDLDIDGLTHDDAPVLAFDHGDILRDAVERVRAKLEYTTLAAAFCVEPFSLADLRRVYVAAWGLAPELANFRRKVLSTEGFVVPEHIAEHPGRGRPPLLYRRGAAAQLHPPILRADVVAHG